MYGHQIERAILSDSVTRRTFQGAETWEHVNIPRQRPSVIIANTDDSTGPGKHWVVFLSKTWKTWIFRFIGKITRALWIQCEKKV